MVINDCVICNFRGTRFVDLRLIKSIMRASRTYLEKWNRLVFSTVDYFNLDKNGIDLYIGIPKMHSTRGIPNR